MSNTNPVQQPMVKLPVTDHVKLDFDAACREYGIQKTPENLRIFCAGAAVSGLTFDVYATDAKMLPINAPDARSAIATYIDAADTIANTPL